MALPLIRIIKATTDSSVPSYGRPHVAPPIIPRLPRRRSSTAEKYRDMLEPGEELVTIVRRHPIGILGYYLEVFFGLLVVIGFLAFLLFSFSDSLSDASSAALIGGGVFAVA